MQVRHLTAADYVRQPWRNGRGVTVELAREGDADGQMLWRLSIADVVEPGPFSLFPGIERVIMLLDGAGFDLDFGAQGRTALTTALAPVAFSGDWTTHAENVRGPSRDLNLMTARDRVQAVVSVHDGPFAASGVDRRLLYAVDPAEVRHGDDMTKLEAGDLLCLSCARDMEVGGQGARIVRIDLTLAAQGRPGLSQRYAPGDSGPST